jgi:hypothetical protein
MYVRCLVLTKESNKRKQPDDDEVAMMFKDELWGAFYSQIAIIVPVAVQSGIAMAQGIKRLYDTCPCEHLKRLGLTLLALTVQHFSIEYLFLSLIGPFKRHIERELYDRGVPYVSTGYRSLWWAFHETDGDGVGSPWFDICDTQVHFTKKDKFRSEDAVELVINPTNCPRRVLLLNPGYYYNGLRERDPDYRPPPLLPLKTHDFLWFIAGEGVLIVHGPSLAAKVLACAGLS